MPLYLNSFKNNLPLGVTEDLDLIGFDIFKKKLEKLFFAKVKVSRCLSEGPNVELVVEVSSSISLALAIEHFRLEVLSNSGANANFLKNCLSELQAVNRETIDIRELSFLMSDTSIFIQKVCEFSIVRQLDNIVRLVIHDYNCIVSQMKEVPIEIHIPVLENPEYKVGKQNFLTDLTRQSTERDYFNYWGLYFDSLDETTIYDVEKSSFIFEELCYIYD